MNMNQNFQIDLTEIFPRLHHAPVVEAVIQFDAPPAKPFQKTELRELLAATFTGYTIHELMRHEAGFRASSGGNVETHQKSHWDGFRLQSEDEKHICQWKQGSLVFSRMQPYETWPDLLKAAMPFWETYRNVGQPAIIESIGVRYISQIPLGESENASKYIQQVPLPLKGLGLRSESFFHQDAIPLKGRPYEIRLIRAMQPAAEKSGSK
jgi:uncharacterized protein (TIGR04255 family)